MTRWSVASAIVATTLLLTTVNGQQQPQRNDRQDDTFVAGEILLQFSPTLNAEQRRSVLRGRNATPIRWFEALGIEHARVPPGIAVAAAVGGFRGLPGVLNVQPNYIRRAIPGPPPNDPFWLDGSMWGLNKIQAPAAWTNFTAGDGSVIIADIDTGVDYTHPDLAANIWRNPFEIPNNGFDDDGNGYVDDVHGIDSVNHDSDPMDDQGHGTHTSGTIAAVGNNGIGVTGVNWNAKVLSCKFLSAEGSGTDAGAIECFDYILAMKMNGVNIRVTSNSWGAQRGSGPPATSLQAAIDAVGAAGIVNVFGAGNDSSNNDVAPFDPASYSSPSIISVASSGSSDRRSFFSNYGATSVDLAAPGENILSTYPGGDYQYSSGTSMATPHVAGVAALLAKMDPTLSVPAIKSLILDNVDKSAKWNGLVVSGGRLNAYRAASAVGTVPNNEPPIATLTSPAEGSIFKAPVSISVGAIASDSDGSIQHVTFYANGSPIGTAASSPYAIGWNAAPGTYTLTAVATDDRWATTTSAPVHISVADNSPPTVAITNPAAGSVFAGPAQIAIDATAADSDGSIQHVAFFADGVLLGTDQTEPYGVTWNAPMGPHTLTVQATDNLGATATSAPVSITVNPLAGRINVARTTNGGVATASSTLNSNYPPSGAINGDRKGLNWGAGGGWNDGTQNAGPDWIEVAFNGLKLIEEVNVFSMQDNYTAPVDPTPTMTFTLWGLRAFEMQYWDGGSWIALPGGVVANNNLVWRQTLFAPITTSKIRVYITAALNGYSRVIEVEAWGVASGANAPPNVAITSPAAGATFTAPANVTVVASASDSDGSVQFVDFYADGVLIGTDDVAPYSVAWTNVSPGTYSLTAVATDNQGETTTSSPVQVSVSAANAPPTVSITSPIDGQSFVAPATLTVSADAADSDGTVASVAFFANGAAIGTATSSPFSILWTVLTPGTYALTAVATDSLGTTTTSAPVVVTVIANPNRLNVALATNGGVATASSTLNANYPPAGAINGDRRGLNWGAGGGWNDGTQNASPDWIEVAFNGPKTIDEINVFSMQDNYTSPVEPTPAMTFTLWGLRTFDVQYWTGTAWATVPGGAISNNTLVWRQVTFPALTTSRIRVHITAALNGYSRVIEVEAWGAVAAPPPPPVNSPPTVTLTSPANGAMFSEPATITVSADASDSDGTIASVAFFANGSPIGTSVTNPFSVVWSSVAAGSYTLTAVATDNLGATATSAPVMVTVNQAVRANWARSANGGTATASSTLNGNYPASGAINGDRRGLSWGAGGGWNDGTLNSYPDWIEIAFNGPKTIDEVSVFSMQDGYTNPADPTPTMTFTLWGLRAFEVQYWTGTAWAPIPGASITNNNLVWRRFLVTPVTTSRIRVHITAALNGYSRVIEVEAWGTESQSALAATQRGISRSQLIIRR